MTDTDSPWRALWRDPIVRLTLVCTTLLALVYVLPILPRERLAQLAAHFLDAPFVALVLLALRFRLSRIADPRERRFWDMLSLSFGCWLLVEVGDVLMISAAGGSVSFELARNLSYVAFYVFFVLALEQRPHLPVDHVSSQLLRRLELAGAIVFVLGLLVYFTLIPALVDPSEYWSTSQALYAVLDFYLLLRLVRLRPSVSASPHWHAVYGALAVAAGFWLLTDSIEMLMAAGVVPSVEFGTALDLLWYPALLATIAAARIREHPFPQLSVPVAEEFSQPLWGGSLIGFAVAFPLIHGALAVSGTLVGPTRSPRELATLVLLVVLGALTLAYQELIRGEVERLDAERNAARLQIEHQAGHDYLTGLPNRRLFLEHLDVAISRSRRYATSLAILFVDLDRFKEINDSLGHATGDRFLQALAQRLRESIRQEDSLARVGGDEFLILVHGLRSSADVTRVARTVLEAATTPVVVDERELVVSASVGICLFPEDGSEPLELVENADAAMYRAKQSGGNAYQLFAPAMNREARDRLALEGDLRRALAEGQIEVHYQPVVSLATGRLFGCEALVRWRHPERGLLVPEAFLGAAEASGLIVPLGLEVLGAAVRQAARWARSGLGLQISVNLSGRQLREPDLLKAIQQQLAESGLPPERLELEVTETAALHNEEQTARILAALRTLGVKIVLDDFGTGFSSLSHLSRLPIDVVKIDHSFVREVAGGRRDAAIAAAIVDLAASLGLDVTAEGVETRTQLERLRQMGCDRVQGNLLAPPMPPEELDVARASWLPAANG